MNNLDSETKRKLREMGATNLLAAFEAEDDQVTMHLSFEARMQLVIDHAYLSFMDSKVTGLVKRANLRYPDAELRRIDFIEERGLNPNTIANLANCSFVELRRNVVFQGFTGSGKSYLGCAVARQACRHRYRAHYVRMPDLEEAWIQAKDKPLGTTRFLKKYAAFSVLVVDEWLLNRPNEDTRNMLLELMERRYSHVSTVFCTQYPLKDWHHRLGGGVHADAIMDRITHNADWIETGDFNMRERTTRTQP